MIKSVGVSLKREVYMFLFRQFTIAVFCILSFNFVTAQSFFKQNIAFRADFFSGVVLPEYQFVTQLVNKPIHGFEVGIAKRTSGKSVMDQAYRYPQFGITFQYTTLGNSEVFGDELGLYPYFQVYFNRGKRIQFFNQFGLGVGYATKRFSLEDNKNNIAVGSHFNIHFNYKFGASFDVKNRLSLNAGLMFTHFSNANMAEPNLGLNLFSGFVGMNYRVSKESMRLESEIPQLIKKHEFDFVYAFGGKHTRALLSKVYVTSSLSAEYHYHLRRKFHIGVGLDLFYDSSAKTEYPNISAADYKYKNDYTSGVHLSQEVIYKNFSFILQEGVQIGIVNDRTFGKMYNRAIVRCKATEHLLIHISMKSHLHILDYPELGFGYFFTNTKK